ncbi:hypothetical protein HNP84_009162 [Thermocatellispora tengchongensis]|uniref:GNAT family N-acetyltransferase n=1 Tax=Thermocatellispora tengchongensis TaxID=1073253 RepID=A0A840PKD0_9ACTN|nr:hypothetical protein [Thermocatellispora tengchongensis]MBB5139399.1 hypothetical protein [Thermocatellispora tengchongensis]
MTTVIRQAEVGDAPRIAVLLGQLGYPARADEVVVRIGHWLADSHSALLVAEPGSPSATVRRA